jgi:hypothetical protein
MNINYAVELSCTCDAIISDDYGLSTDKTFRWITGRPSYNGVDNFPKWEDDTDNTEIWYEGILTKDSLSNPSRRIDLSVSGEYGTLSGINIKIVNYNKFFDFLQSNDIYITGRSVKVYVVLDDKFYQIWNGSVNNISYDETTYTLECKDNYKQIHKVMPPNVISVAEFPESEAQGETIPITIGNVAYAKLLDAGIKPYYADLNATDSFFETHTRVRDFNILYREENFNSSYKYKIAAMTNYVGKYGYTSTYITLATRDIIIEEDSLAGYYIIGRSGNGLDTEYASYIVSNTLTSNGETIFTIAGDFQGINYDTMHTHYYQNEFTDEIWWFSVAKLTNVLLISDSDISSLKQDKFNNYYLYNFDNEKKVFSRIDSIIRAVGVTGIQGYNYPGIEIISKKMSIDGDISYNYFIIPTQFKVLSSFDRNLNQKINTLEYKEEGSVESSMEFTELGSDWTNAINDKNINSYVVCKNRTEVNRYLYEAAVDLLLPADNLNDGFSSLYACVDYRIESRASEVNVLTYTTIQFFDVYDNVIKEVTTQFLYPANATYTTTPIDIRQLPDGYYYGGKPWSNFDYGTDKHFWGRTDLYIDGGTGNTEYEIYTDQLEIDSDLVEKVRDGLISAKVRILITVKGESAGGAGNCNIYIYQAGIVARKNLDIISDDMYASITGEGYTGIESSVYTAYKTILEQYDHYGYTGGYTGMSLGYTGANWIDYSNLPDVRSDWHVGYQITEQKNSYNYLNDLSKQSFVGMFPTREGNRKLVAWRDLTDYTATIGETGIIRDSITDFKKSDPSQIYNDFKCEYSYNQATKKFDRCLVVTRSDDESFPESSDPTWKQYVQGLNTNSYADAKIIWDIAHNAYNVTNTIQQNSTDTQKLYWYYDQSIFNNTEFVGASVDDAAYRFLQNLVEWVGLRKDECTFSVPLTPSNIQLELCDMVLFEDGFFTDGIQRKGWITLIEVDTKNHRIKLQVTLEPIELMEDDVIIERGIPLNVDIIEESGSQPDIIIES